MKKLIFLGLSVAAVSAFGTTLTDQCAANGSVTVTFATTLGTIQCGDKQFSNFTGTVTGSVQISENSTTSYELLLKAPVGGITTGFNFGYTVAVDPGVCATCVITQIQQNMQTTSVVVGQQIPNGSTGVNTINNGGVFSPGTTNGLTSPGQNTLASPLGGTSYTLGFQYNPNGNSGPAAGVFLNLDDIITQNPVPEPVSLSLTGLGLLGLGFFGRRRLKA